MNYRGMENPRNQMTRSKVRAMYNKHNDQIPPGSRARFVPGMPIPGQQPSYSQVGFARTAQYPTIHSPDFPTVQYTPQATPVWSSPIPITMSDTYQMSNQHSFPPQQQMYNADTSHMMTVPSNAFISQVQNQTEYDPISSACHCSKCGFPNTLALLHIKRLTEDNKRLMEQNLNYEENARASPAMQASLPVSSLSVDAQPFQMGVTQGPKILQGTNVTTEVTAEASNRQQNPNGHEYSHHSGRGWESQCNTPVVSASHVTNDQYNDSTTSDPEWNNADYSQQESVNNDTSNQQETESAVLSETPNVSANDEWDLSESAQEDSNVVLTSSGPFTKTQDKHEDESIVEREQINSTPQHEGHYDRNATEIPKSRAAKDQRPRTNRNRGGRSEGYDGNWDNESRRSFGRRESGGFRSTSPQDQKERRGEKNVADSRDSSQSRVRSGPDYADRKDSNSGDGGIKGVDSTERNPPERCLDSSGDRTYPSHSRLDSGDRYGRRGGGNQRRFNEQVGRGKVSDESNWRAPKDQDSNDRRDFTRSGSRGGSSSVPRRYPASNSKVITEKEGDLFGAPDEYSLAHCVAEDLRMGSGIAVRFRQLFKNVDELCDQKKGVGQVAVLGDKGRFIFYLITKERSNGKPLWNDFVATVEELKRECVEKGVKNLAMPRIGCGLDRLDWQKVRKLLENTFCDSSVSITAYNFQQIEEAESQAVKSKSFLHIFHVRKNLVDIDAETGIVFLCSEEPNTNDRTIESLDKKHKFLYDLRTAKKSVGEVVTIKKGREYLYGLVAKKLDTDPLSYVNLGKCLRKMRNTNSKEQYGFFGMEAFRDGNDHLTMEKVMTCLRNVFGGIQYRMEFYICWPKELENDNVWEDQNARNMTPSSK